MNMPGTAAPAGSSLLRDWLNALRYWLVGRTGLIVSLGLLAAIGIGLGWSWLVAIGVAPLLVAVLPCAAMCALGLCASRLGGRGCSSEAKTPSPEPQVGIQASMRASAPGQELAPPAAEGPRGDAPERADLMPPSEPSDERRT